MSAQDVTAQLEAMTARLAAVEAGLAALTARLGVVMDGAEELLRQEGVDVKRLARQLAPAPAEAPRLEVVR